MDQKEEEQEQEEISTEEHKSKGEDNHDHSQDHGSHNQEADDLVPEPSEHNLQLLLPSFRLPETPQTQHTGGSASVPGYIRNGTSLCDADRLIGLRRINIQLTEIGFHFNYNFISHLSLIEKSPYVCYMIFLDFVIKLCYSSTN